MDTTGQAVGGLVKYVRAVADDLGDEVSEVDVDVGGLATAIILVRSHVPTLVEFPLLLTWDEVSGWALRIETDGRGDTTPVVFMGGDILPEPESVQRFLRAATTGEHPGTPLPPAFRLPNAPDDLERRLAHFGC
ncbi:hypothetical protein GCM10011581_28220 [Saccharopolyspora subtropica]|uniref:DUF6292 domain-containing protein n=1 Tax=Saccharopolyspora thermophila TaxID=89367 RepID=A0A917JVR7_9PSEU|nr:DUF6292 family protein [Saccharopolyspora subtropica]GGI89503.1 hypothetical protein GCM10011581_28220 [Saccharopolyspora subtropica]